MKTTVEIPKVLLDDARKVAEREGTTLRVLIEEGLRRSLAERRRRPVFRLRKASFKGDGLQSGVDDAWETIRDLAYSGRGT